MLCGGNPRFLASFKDRKCNTKAFKRFLELYQPTRETVTKDDNEFFIRLAENGCLEILKILQSTYNLTANDARSQYNDALILAASNGHVNVLQWVNN